MHNKPLSKQYLILLPALFFVIAPLHVHTMDTVTAATNTSIGNRLMTRLLTYGVYTSDDVATAIRSILQLQQTCKFWFSELSNQNKKEIVEACFFNGQDIDLNQKLAVSLEIQRSHIFATAMHQCNPSNDSDDQLSFPITTAPELYLFADANIHTHDQYGRSLMGLAAALQTAKYLRMLIKRRGNIMITDTQEDPYLLQPHVIVSNNGPSEIYRPPKDGIIYYLQDCVGNNPLHKGKTPFFYAVESKSDENQKLINMLTNIISTVWIKQKYYTETTILNAREALEFIDKNVDVNGMVRYDDYYESDDE